MRQALLRPPPGRPARRGMTLVELIVVLAVLVALASMVVPLISSTSESSQDIATRTSMTALRNAVIAYSLDMKGVALPNFPGSTGVPATLKDLVLQPASAPNFDPYTRLGWRGPYIVPTLAAEMLPGSATPVAGVSISTSFYPTGNPYGTPGDPAFLDGWGNPIVLQWPDSSTGSITTRAQNVRLVSAGTGGVLDTVSTTLMPTHPTASQTTAVNQRGNDYVQFVFTQDQYP